MVRATEEQNLFLFSCNWFKWPQWLVATIFDSIDVKVTTGVGILTSLESCHGWQATGWLFKAHLLPPAPTCPPHSALEEIAMFALSGPTASRQQMTKLIKHAAHPPVPSFPLMTFGHTRTSLRSFHTH